MTVSWKDYEIIATGDGKKLERWGDIYLLRPDPQVIWRAQFELERYPKLHAKYVANGRLGEKWEILRPVPETFKVGYNGLTFALKLMKGFKHTGLFPEQAYNWARMGAIIKSCNRSINVLNLFAYTGGATLACLAAGASVCHVDAAQSMIQRAKENAALSGLADKNVRYIVDDCTKFVARELRRGRRYDAVIMDPPSFGRGPDGELWKLENNLYDLIAKTVGLLSEKPLFYLVNSYTTGLQPTVIKNLLDLNLRGYNAQLTAYELTLPTAEGIELPCGASGLAVFR